MGITSIPGGIVDGAGHNDQMVLGFISKGKGSAWIVYRMRCMIFDFRPSMLFKQLLGLGELRAGQEQGLMGGFTWTLKI